MLAKRDSESCSYQGNLIQWQWYANDSIKAVRVADIDNDGQAEIIAGSQDGNVYVLTGTGEEKWHYFTGEEVWSLALADLDDNGHREIIVGFANRETLVILSATGKMRGILKGYGAAWRLETADLNGDQKSEILLGSRNRRLYALSKDGAELWEFDASPSVLSLAVVDLNNDGKEEIIVGSENGKISILDSSGQVLSQTSVENFVMSLSAADVNNDDQIEICVGCADNHLYLLTSDLKVIWSFETTSWVRDSLVFDVDDDGESEIVFGTNGGTVHVLMPNGIEKYRWEMGSHVRALAQASSISEQPAILIIALENGWLYALSAIYSRPLESIMTSLTIRPIDELTDMLQKATQSMESMNYREALASLIRAADFRVIKWNYSTDCIVRRVVVADVNQDGKDEVLIASDDHHLRILSGKGDLLEEWRPTEGRIQGISIVDIDNDGALEVLVATGQTIYVLTVTLQVKRSIDWKQKIVSLYVGNIDSDGIPEIIVGTADGALSVRTPKEELKWSLNTGGWITSIQAKDINNDGENEILVTSTDHNLYILTAYGNEISRFTANGPIWDASITDIDRDSQDEILAVSDDGHTYVLSNTGRELWRFRTRSPVQSVSALDIDGDGDTEILVGPAEDNIVRVLNSKGQEKQRFRLRRGDRFVVLQDIDEDGIPEYLIASKNGLYVLGNPHQKLIADQIKNYWDKYSTLSQDKGLLEDDDEEIRAFAANQLLTSDHLDSRTVEQLALDPSIKVRKVCAANLAIWAAKHPDEILPVLEKLYQERDEELRRIIGHTVSLLIAQNGLTDLFTILKRLATDTGRQVRQDALLQLARLASVYPEEVFRILSETCKDENDWTLHETARVLELLFEYDHKAMYSRMRSLVEIGCRPVVFAYLAQISTNPRIEFITTFYRSLLTNANSRELLERFGNQIETFCQRLVQFSEFASVEEIARTSYLDDTDWHSYLPETHFEEAGDVLATLMDVTLALARQAKVRDIQDKVGYLNRALMLLDEAETIAKTKTVICTESLVRVIVAWRGVIRRALIAVRGLPQVQARLRNKSIPYQRNVQVVIDLENNGTGLAEELNVTLSETQDYMISGKACQSLEILPSGGEKRSIFFAISPRNRETVGISATLTYKDLEGITHTQGIGDRIEFIDSSKEFVPINPNPYVAGRPLRRGDYFVGRQDILEFVRTNLMNRKYGTVLILFGERRCGKTSILHRLEQEQSEKFVPIFFDMQSIGNRNISHLIFLLAKSIVQTLSQRTANLELPAESSFSVDAFSEMDTFLDSVESILRARNLTATLMIDEFEELESLAKDHAQEYNLLGYLRSIVQRRETFSFIFVGTQRLKHLASDYGSELFNLGKFRKVDVLSKEDAIELITLPVRDRMIYEQDALDKILEATGHQPFLLQFVCEYIVNQANENRRAYVAVSEVNSVLARVIHECPYFDSIWNTLDSRLRIIVSALANTLMDSMDNASLSAIEVTLGKANVRFERKEALEVLKELTDRDLILDRDLGFRFKIDLMRLWVRASQRIERVAEQYAS